MEFFDFFKNKKVDKPEAAMVQSRQLEFKKVSTWRPQRGHTIFKFNTKTKELARAEIQRTALIDIRQQVHYEKKIFVEKDCIYIEALNKKNAIKQLRREGLL